MELKDRKALVVGLARTGAAAAWSDARHAIADVALHLEVTLCPGLGTVEPSGIVETGWVPNLRSLVKTGEVLVLRVVAG